MGTFLRDLRRSTLPWVSWAQSNSLGKWTASSGKERLCLLRWHRKAVVPILRCHSWRSGTDCTCPSPSHSHLRWVLLFPILDEKNSLWLRVRETISSKPGSPAHIWSDPSLLLVVVLCNKKWMLTRQIQRTETTQGKTVGRHQAKEKTKRDRQGLIF